MADNWTLVICQLSASTATLPVTHLPLSLRVASLITTVRCYFPLYLCFYHLFHPLTSLQHHCHRPLSLVLILSTMDQEPPRPEKKKRGRPKGSKDKPRQPGDKPRGRPKKAPKPAQAARAVDAADVDGKSGS